MTQIFTRRTFEKLSTFVLLCCASPAVFAAGQTPWKSYLFLVIGISTLFAIILSVRNKKTESLMGKLLLGGLYFWVLSFAQLIILALLYYLNK